MPTFKAQKIPRKEVASEDLLASFCYHFPQYTYATARRMPYRRILQMLKVANKEHAKKMIDLAHIMAAANSQKKGAIKEVVNRFNDIINK